MAKGYKRYTLEKAMEIIAENGLRGMNESELRSVGRPIMTEVRRRKKLLRKSDYKDSPAYKAYSDLNLKTSTSSEIRNVLLTEVYNAYLFLQAKTSTVQGVQTYLDKLDTLFGREVNLEEGKLVWAAIDMLRKDKDTAKIFEDFSYNIVLEELAVEAEFAVASNSKTKARDAAEKVLKMLNDLKAKQENSDEFDYNAEEDVFSYSDKPLWTGRIL